MAQYYYDKYSALLTYSTSFLASNSVVYDYSVATMQSFSQAWATGLPTYSSYVPNSASVVFTTGYQLNTSTGVFSNTGGTVAYGTTYVYGMSNAGVGHAVVNGGKYLLQISVTMTADNKYSVYMSVHTASSSYTKGTLSQSNIVAEDGTYPANGRHTDGYWYVRKEPVPLPTEGTMFAVKKAAVLVMDGNDNLANNRVFSIDATNTKVGDLVLIYGLVNNVDTHKTGEFSGFTRLHSDKALNQTAWYYKQIDTTNAGKAFTTTFTNSKAITTANFGYMIVEQAMIKEVIDREVTTGSGNASGNRSTYEPINFNRTQPFMVFSEFMHPVAAGGAETDNFIPTNYKLQSGLIGVIRPYGAVYPQGSTETENAPATRIAWGTKNGTYIQHYLVLTAYNKLPEITVNTTNNSTLYENDVFNISGTASDADNGNTVTIRYQINALTTRAIKAFLSDGTTLESFSKSLTFKGGNLYDGTTLIAENLSDGVAHTLKVWATDDQGGTSVIKEIPFYVVPNRAPLLTVNSPVINGLIDSDKFNINGTFEDSDGNTTVVSYRINGSTSVQVTEGVSGPFTFDVSFGQLNVGLNQIVIEAMDSYGAKVSKTIKLNKNEVKSEQLRSTARYKINPPTGSARAVLLWIQRDRNLDIDVAISMTMQGEAESFTPLTISNSAPLDQGNSIIEDEFYYEVDSPKDNIILQIDMERTSLEVNDKIYLISGVLD